MGRRSKALALSAIIMVIALDRMFAANLVPGGIVLCVLTYAFRGVLKRFHKNIQESDGRLRVVDVRTLSDDEYRELRRTGTVRAFDAQAEGGRER